MAFFDVIVGTPQGKVATIGYAVLFLTIIVSVIIQQRKPGATKVSVPEVFVMFVLLVIAYLLSIFSINCMVVGASTFSSCGLWAWANSVLVIVVAVAVLLSALFDRSSM